jgi:hypothetical protein
MGLLGFFLLEAVAPFFPLLFSTLLRSFNIRDELPSGSYMANYHQAFCSCGSAPPLSRYRDLAPGHCILLGKLHICARGRSSHRQHNFCTKASKIPGSQKPFVVLWYPTPGRTRQGIKTQILVMRQKDIGNST